MAPTGQEKSGNFDTETCVFLFVGTCILTKRCEWLTTLFAKAMVQMWRKPLTFSFTLVLVTLVYKKCIRRLIVAEALLWMLNETSAIDMHVLFFIKELNTTQFKIKAASMSFYFLVKKTLKCYVGISLSMLASLSGTRATPLIHQHLAEA